MKYTLSFTETALKDLKKLDKHTAAIIIGWIERNLNDCENPRAHGKALVRSRAGTWRYRIGDYRLICEIRDERLVILALTVGHRREVHSVK